ncbi:MAG: ATPase [Bacteroidia bacterium]|nr:MAG: ATPase [Bacteroidia bacterium]
MHYFNIQEILKELNVPQNGLSKSEVQKRISEFGKNELQEKKKKTALQIFIGQFMDFMILILGAAAVLSIFIGDYTDSIIILVIVFLNALIGFYQEYKAEQALDSLKKLARTQTQVLREGKWELVDSADLVPGDQIMLEAGNSVPADVRWIEAHSVKVDESALTGESLSVDKIAENIHPKDTPLGDRSNMSYKGTLVTSGRGIAIVYKTGMNTEIGKIASMLQMEESDTPLKKRMADFSKKLTYLIILVCLVIIGLGYLRNEDLFQMLMVGISLAVAAIPEALPALITVSLAIGAKRMVKKNALIRKLHAVETLGSVSIICSDKTGTLTVNKMKVVNHQDFSTIHFQNYSPLILNLALNHEVKIQENKDWIGDPTEIALVEKAIDLLQIHEYNKLSQNFPRVSEIPFDSVRKCMTTVHAWNNQFLVLTKGATESITKRLNPSNPITEIEEISEQWANEGNRVLAFAYKIVDQLPPSEQLQELETNLELAGLVAMIDPPREEVFAAIQECLQAGIKPVMITGDHPATAIAIGKAIGIFKDGDLAWTGAEMDKMPETEFKENVHKVSIFARVSPEQKLKIVNALKAKGFYVAMTGDGVNDAPSLKAADIGVAMGINGTDVSKEAADMVLLDDNFATIVKAVREGRRIFDNIRKFVKYIMTCNSAEIMTILFAPLLGLPLPLLPIHILWINLVTDGVPGLALAYEKEDPDIMNRPPRPSNESLFAHGNGYHILWVGFLMAVITLLTQHLSMQNFGTHWQTMVFSVLAFSQLGHVLAIRSEKQFLFQKGIFSNPFLIQTIILTSILQLLVIYTPIGNQLFKTEPLTITELGLCFAMSAIVFHAVELEKWIKSKI